MNYREKKQELIKMRDTILKKYDSLLSDALRFGKISSDLVDSDLSPQEVLDFMEFTSMDSSTMKITSLMAALMYVEYPEDKEVAATLKRDIDINKHGRK